MYTPHQFRTGAGAYARVGVESTAMSATPLQLIMMLFDGAKTAIGAARHHMGAGEIAPKGSAISRAINIVDNGLKASLDAQAAGEAGGELVSNLSALYDYVVRLLLLANVRNDVGSLDEADRLLETIASAWREIDSQSRG
jgi:flagellar protein FliS